MESIDKYIVSIDLGTSKIAVTAAKVEGSNVQIVYYKETPSDGIRYSSIMNVKQAQDAIKAAVAEAEANLSIKISQAVVCMPKYPIQMETACGKKVGRGEDTEITEESVEDLKRSALETYPIQDSERNMVFGAVAQSFSDGEHFQVIEKDVIGMMSDILEGYFKIFIGKKGDVRRIDQTMDRIGIVPAEKFFTAESTAKVTLTSQEMDNGVALVDFGGGCTSVSIYLGNIMRYYASIPFGGRNITDDIRNEAEISERLAENIKIEYGACMPENLHSMSEKIIQIQDAGSENKKRISVKYLSEVITARVEEIIMAILYEIEQSGIADELKCGIVVTGGVANTVNLCKFITEITGYKARTGYPIAPVSHIDCPSLTNPSAASSIGMIMAALNRTDEGCAQPLEEKETVREEEVQEKADSPKEDNTGNRDLFGNPIKEKKENNTESHTNSTGTRRSRSKSNEPTLWSQLKDEIKDILNNGNGRV